ncbi:MAG: glycosyltransferase [Methylococcaceae bacterium]|nr:glycosyltransferase [Prolixibacteraceae bacterium]
MKLINFQMLTITDMVLLTIFCVVFIIQIYYLLGIYLKLVLHKKENFTGESLPVTLIVSLRNEEERIRDLMERLTSLAYEDYQVIVINEFSEDNTLEILNVLAETNPHIKITSLSQETRFLEKQAINLGMKAAKAPWIVQLTPDTHTLHNEWLTKLTGLVDKNTDAVVAYSNIERAKGFRNLIIRLERFNQFMISGSWILKGLPFVFSENNILFRKTLYFGTQGFRMKLNRNFANLELIFNENFSRDNVRITTNPDLSVHEKMEDDRREHYKLIRKSVQIRQSLSWAIKFSLFIDDLTKILLPAIATTLVIMHPEYWITYSAVLVVYYTTLLIIVKKLLNRLKERKIFVSSFIYILIKPFINWWVYWSTYLIHHRNKWN